MMDFKALIEFNKYTLALAATAVVYGIEKFVPVGTPLRWWIFIVTLSCLLASIVIGILIFAGATAALHGDDDRRKKIQKYMRWLGISHSTLLFVGMVFLAGMLYELVVAAPLVNGERTFGPGCSLMNLELEGQSKISYLTCRPP